MYFGLRDPSPGALRTPTSPRWGEGDLKFITCCALILFSCNPQRQDGASPMPDAKPHFDLRIINGEVIDGTGAPRKRADVGIRGDTIVEIGDLSRSAAAVTIDAAGQVVTPGFIDLLGQSEGSVLMDPHLEGKVRQGVTT